MLGSIKNGGLGTATSYLALALANQGNDVEILHFGYNREVEQGWAQRYRAAGITVTQLPRLTQTISPYYLSVSYTIYCYLRTREADAVVFQDWHGAGFCSLRAKQLGLAFGETTLALYCHGPTEWLFEANRRFPTDAGDIARSVMERTCTGLADVLVSPSAYLIEWMRARGWILPARTYVVPLFSESTAVADVALKRDRNGRGPREIVYFGRLEDRKGIEVFIEALNAVDPTLLAGRKVTFLGRKDTWSPKRVRSRLEPAVAATAEIEFITDLAQREALAHLERSAVLAVMPSLTDNSPCVIYECMERGIAFITSNTGGGPELIREQDKPAVLFAPHPGDLADRLRSLLTGTEPPPVARPSFTAEDLHEGWSAALAPSTSQRAVPAAEPRVSVVVTHYERPRLVSLTLEALRDQDYPNMEVILVDDGSSSREAIEMLSALESSPWPWPFRVIRQENRYLGAARNIGWRAAEGPLVAFLDDDDLPYPEFIRTLITAHLTSGADVVTCGMRFFREAEGPPRPEVDDVTWLYLGEPLELGLIHNQYGGACSLWRRSVLESAGGFHELHGVTYEDWELLARASLGGASIVSVPDPLVWYRITDGSMIRTKKEYECQRVLTDTFARTLPPSLRAIPSLVHVGYNTPGPAAVGRAWRALRVNPRDHLGHARILARRSIEVGREDGLKEVFTRGVAWIRRGGKPPT
jgi:glycosyltransferase involved in cell wall biosynthesis/GT2 family glycosyltransferase